MAKVRKLRIDLVITELNQGGAEQCCTDLALFLVSHGHLPRVVSIGPRPRPPHDTQIQRLDRGAVPMQFIGTQKWYQFPLAWWRLRQLVKSDPPAIAQSFLWHANVMSAAVYPSLGVPLVGGNRVAEPRSYRHFLGARAAKKMSKVVCVSQAIADWTFDQESVPIEKLCVIPNGVDPQSIDRQKQHPDPDPRPILLFVGRLNPQKGVDVLLEKMPALLTALPNHRIVIIGDGSMRATVVSQVQRLQDPSRVQILGQRDDAIAWMHRSQILLLPTRYEGMPNVILEAMACGIPVATMGVEGIAEVLGPNLMEQAAKKYHWDEWYQLVVQIASSPERILRLGTLNRIRVETFFQLHAQLRKYEDLYLALTHSPLAH